MEAMADNTNNEEAYNKSKSVQITSMVSGILKNAGIIGNPIQSMMARNIRHFENIRKQALESTLKDLEKQERKQCGCKDK